MMHTKIVPIILLALVMSGCTAKYHTQTNKASDYTARLDKVFIWSAIGQAGPLGSLKFYDGETYESYFHAAVKRAFAAANVQLDVRSLSNDLKPEDLVRVESDLAPSARLIIQPKKYITRDSIIQQLWLDLSLYDLSTNRRVWRGETYVSTYNTGGAFMWTASGARDLADAIVAALANDGLVEVTKAKVR